MTLGPYFIYVRHTTGIKLRGSGSCRALFMSFGTARSKQASTCLLCFDARCFVLICLPRFDYSTPTVAKVSLSFNPTSSLPPFRDSKQLEHHSSLPRHKRTAFWSLDMRMVVVVLRHIK